MLVTMSDKELSRINVIQSVVEKRMLRRDAARQLNAWCSAEADARQDG